MSSKGREIRRAAGVLLLALMVPACARADTIFSNFGSGYTDSGNAVSVAGSSAGGEFYAVAFTPAEEATFTDAITDLLWFGGQNTVGAYILADDAGVPGAGLASIDQSTPVTNGPEMFTCSISCPLLLAGTQYWLKLKESDPDTDIGWYVTTSDLPVDFNYVQGYTFYSSGMWWPNWPRNVFEIDGNPVLPLNPNPESAADPVPEAGTFTMLLAGLLALSCAALRKCGAFRSARGNC
jgi:hypothetical protein